jgi:ABC-type antimicrobial peptide transport system permease subunit
MSKGFGGGLFLRRGLVVFQFFISQLLIIGTIIVTMQMDYFHSKDMGFDKNAVVVVSLPDNDATKLQTFRTELLQNNLIRNVSFNYSSASSGGRWDADLKHNIRGTEEDFVSDLKFADTEYMSTYGLQLVAGRNYVPSDTISEFVVNETFAKKLGAAPQDLIGKLIKLGSRRSYMPIVGVVKDFNSTSLHEEIRPCLLATRRTAYYEAGIKINMQGASEALRHIEKNWTATFPEFVYNYEFLDERVAGFYAEEQKMSQLFRAFSSIAILIGCIGLFGLVSFMAAQRTKEIGVRKVLGATMRHILIIFSRELAVLVVAAFVIAVPVGYLVMNNWLENFAYRIEIGAPVLALAFISSALIAALTVGYRAIKAATANPVESLRYE